MKKFLLAGVVVLFAGVATAAVAADHKGSKPAAPRHAAVVAPAKHEVHKESPKHHAAKHKAAHKARKAHTK